MPRLGVLLSFTMNDVNTGWVGWQDSVFTTFTVNDVNTPGTKKPQAIPNLGLFALS